MSIVMLDGHELINQFLSSRAQIVRRFMEMVKFGGMIQVLPLNNLALVNLQPFSRLVECSFLNARVITHPLFFS